MKTRARAIFFATLLAVAQGLLGETQTVHYTYSQAGRLVAVDYGGGRGITYTYDPAGNLLRFSVTRFDDTDGDLMDDGWEQQFFGGLDRDGHADFDHDGASDLAEFLAGTTPDDPASFLRVRLLTSDGQAGFTIGWNAVPGKVYRIQYKDDLNSVLWHDLGGEVTAGGPIAVVEDTTAAGQPRRFYRVALIR